MKDPGEVWHSGSTYTMFGYSSGRFKFSNNTVLGIAVVMAECDKF